MLLVEVVIGSNQHILDTLEMNGHESHKDRIMNQESKANQTE